MIKGAIFDLDGTLLATLDSIAKSGNEMLKHFGFPPAPKEQYGVFAGDGADVLVERALNYSGDTSLSHSEEAKRKYREYFREFCDYNVKPYDGISELLDGLCKKNIKLAVFTNKPHENAVKLMKKHFPSYPFTHIFGQCDAYPKKPDPTGMLQILNDWGISPGECVYLGDSNVDMKTGKRANCLTVGALWGFRTKEELLANGADRVISRPLELLDCLE